MTPAPIYPQISSELLNQIDIRAGTIILVENVPGSDRLVKLTVNFGDHTRTILAGIKAKVDHVGLDLRYNYDLASSYTGYHAVRLGAFYEFGR